MPNRRHLEVLSKVSPLLSDDTNDCVSKMLKAGHNTSDIMSCIKERLVEQQTNLNLTYRQTQFSNINKKLRTISFVFFLQTKRVPAHFPRGQKSATRRTSFFRPAGDGGWSGEKLLTFSQKNADLNYSNIGYDIYVQYLYLYCTSTILVCSKSDFRGFRYIIDYLQHVLTEMSF